MKIKAEEMEQGKKMVGTAGFEYTTKEKTYCKINDLEMCISPKTTSNDPETPICGNTVVTGFGGREILILATARSVYANLSLLLI